MLFFASFEVSIDDMPFQTMQLSPPAEKQATRKAQTAAVGVVPAGESAAGAAAAAVEGGIALLDALFTGPLTATIEMIQVDMLMALPLLVSLMR